MLRPHQLFAIASFAVLVLSAGCDTGARRCDPSSCEGCCSAEGVCEPGFLNAACGAGGGLCTPCFEQQSCIQGVCAFMGGGGGGGKPDAGCTPATCDALGKNCGKVADGCGGTLECGTCSGTDTCGGGGTANVCAPGTCTPATCESLSRNCGSLSDGCGDLLDCGSCTSPETCGGGGVANVCGGCQVTTSCAEQGKNCGELPDGCGGTLNCGTCPSNQTCGGGGSANVCGGSSCTPKTCAELGNNCGAVSDGCGSTLNCGTCSGTQTCGGGGVANVCGATCKQTCPQGFTCDASGTCAGGSATGLTLNVTMPPLVQVGGTVRLNGAIPQYSSTSGYCAEVRFDNLNTPDDESFYVPCTSTTFSFTGQVFAGTYKVSVRDYSSKTSLPDYTKELHASLGITSSNTAMTLNVTMPPLVQVGGTVRLNGAIPQYTSTSGYCAEVRFDNLNTPDDESFYVPCSSTTFSFSGQVFAGTYEVSVRDYSSKTSLPDYEKQLHASLGITSSNTAMTLNVTMPPLVQVGGTVRLNGAIPQYTSTSGYCAEVRFENLNTPDDESFYVPCSSTTFSFSGQVFAGTYKVSVRDYSSKTSLPDYEKELHASLSITSSNTAMVLNVTMPPIVQVGGTVRLNGAIPQYTSTSGYCAEVRFDNLNTPDDESFYVPCTSTTFSFSGQVFAGTYKVSVRDYSSKSSLPDYSKELHASLGISSSNTAMTLNVTMPALVQVSGTVRLNGAIPQYTSTSGYCAEVIFENITTPDDESFYVPCTSSTFSYTGQVFAGTYKVSVRDYSSKTSLPDYTVTLFDRIAIQ